jgi:hypothetical protein
MIYEEYITNGKAAAKSKNSNDPVGEAVYMVKNIKISPPMIIIIGTYLKVGGIPPRPFV